MRVLILDFNVKYLNPTFRLWPLIFKSGFDTQFFGPGYVPENILEAGLSNFIKKTGPYDFVIASELVIYYIVLDEDIDRLAGAYLKNYSFSFNIKSVLRYGFRMAQDFLETPARRCITHFVSDLYNFTDSQIETLLKCDAYYIGWGEQFIEKTENLPTLKYEKFGKSANNNIYHFRRFMRREIIWLYYIERLSVPVINFDAFDACVYCLIPDE